MGRRANDKDLRKYPIGDFIKGNFIDDSNNEDSFRIYWNDILAQAQADPDFDFGLKDYPKGEYDNNLYYKFDKVGTGNKIPFASKTASGESGNLDNLITDEIDVGVKAVNKAGESEKTSLGIVQKYNRADFYIYIGSNDLFGSGASSELHKLDGSRGTKLSEALKNALLMNNLKPGSFIKGNWRNADPVLDEDVSAEISFLDYLSGRNNGRDVVVWKLGINNAIASTSFGPSGEGRSLIEQYLNSDFQALYDRFCQPRMAGCIINMRLLDQDVDGAYQNLIDYIRGYLDLPELPIILTDEDETRLDTSNICFQLDPDNATPELRDYYEYRGMGGYYGFAQPDCITAPNFWEWEGEYAQFNTNLRTYKGWSYVWKKLYNLDLSEPSPSETTYIRYTKAKRLWGYFLDSPRDYTDAEVFYHEHGENNYNITEYDKIFGQPSDIVNALRVAGANGFINYSDPTRQNQNFFSNLAYVKSSLLRDGTANLLESTDSNYEFPTVYRSSEIVESHVFQDQYIRYIYGSDFIRAEFNELLPFQKRLTVPRYDNKDPDLEIHSYYNKYKHLMLPYVSGSRNHSGHRGIRTLESIPSKFYNLIRRNKKVRYVSRDLLPLNGQDLTTEGQVMLGEHYAREIDTIHRKTSIEGIEFTLRLDATTGSFTNIGSTGVRNDPQQIVFEDPSSGGVTLPSEDYWFVNPEIELSENFNYDGSINNLPAFRFVNQAFFLHASNVFSNSQYKYIFMVIKPNANIEGKVWSELGNGARSLCHFPWTSYAITDFNTLGQNTHRVDIPEFYVESRPYIVTSAWDSSRNFILMRANGIESRKYIASTETSIQGDSFCIGGVPSRHGRFMWSIEADIGEFMTVDTSIGMDGIIAVENYLSNKWGIPV